MSKNEMYLTDWINDKKYIREIILISGILAFGISLLANGITNLFSSSVYIVSSGIVVAMISLIILVFRIGKKTKGKVKIYSIVTFKRGSNDLIKVPEYEYSDNLKSYLDSIFSENKAIKKLWDDQPISNARTYDKEKKESLTLGKNESLKLVIEATEFCLLEKLSSILSSFYGKVDENSTEIMKYKREDVPEILLKNRVFEILSRPIDQREIFINEPSTISPTRIWSSNGQYIYFDLILPKKTKIKRDENRDITIETAAFNLTLSVKMDGTNSCWPFGFEMEYLGYKNLETVEYHVDIGISVKFKIASFLSPRKWNNNAWIEMLIDEYVKSFSSESFINKINWNLIHAINTCAKNKV